MFKIEKVSAKTIIYKLINYALISDGTRQLDKCSYFVAIFIHVVGEVGHCD